ncbi:MAG: epimerase [Zetaproteobacteria bacterium]|nr:MAG: epimerase [Zetaproteobacteria bacterium]
MAKYCVTGGCGFIGSNLTDALIAAGNDVVVLDNLSSGKAENLHPKAELIVDDICNPQAVVEAMDGVDGCFHLAAIASVQKSNEEWALTHQTNLTGTINIFEGSIQAKNGKAVPVMFASSAAIYGDNASVPLFEAERPSPITAYGADKLGCELHGRVANLVHKVPNYGFRFFNVYGPRQDPKSPYSGVISIFADHVLNQETIHIFGDGSQTRDFVYVGDVIRFLMAGMRHCKNDYDIFNVCTGVKTTIKDLASAMGNIAENNPNIEYLPARVGDINLSLGSPKKIECAFGIKAETRIGEGLEVVLSHMMQERNVSLINKTKGDNYVHT